MLPARALAEPTLGEGPAFQQRTNTSWRSTRSQPAVSRRLFRCLGAHLLRSPSIVKSDLIVLALVSATNEHTPSVELDRSFSPNSVLRHSTSSRCPFASTHSFDPFVRWFSHSWTNKKSCSHRGKQGLENFFGSSFTCLPPGYLNSFQGLALYTMWLG